MARCSWVWLRTCASSSTSMRRGHAGVLTSRPARSVLCVVILESAPTGEGDAVMRSVPVRLLVGLLALTVARSGQAQQMRTGYVNKYHTCRGDSGTHIRIVRLPNDEVALTTVVVFGVDSLSPVGRAGLRNGDQVTLMNGVDLTDLVRGVVAYRDAPGDTNVWKIRNAAGEREIRFVVGHWVKVGADSVCRNDGTATQHPETPPSSK